MNKIMIMGRLGKEPEVKKFDSGSVKTTIKVVTTESYKDKNGDKKEETDWHRIEFWGKTGEALAKFRTRPGHAIIVEGAQRNRSYEDREGNTKYTSYISGKNWWFSVVDSKKSQEADTGDDGDYEKDMDSGVTDDGHTTEPPF